MAGMEDSLAFFYEWVNKKQTLLRCSAVQLFPSTVQQYWTTAKDRLPIVVFLSAKRKFWQMSSHLINTEDTKGTPPWYYSPPEINLFLPCAVA